MEQSSSKICRICGKQSRGLYFLLDAENTPITKKLRSFADISIEQDDLLPKYICRDCRRNLDFAYDFKKQCEYMDRKLREAIAKSIQKHTRVTSSDRSSPTASHTETSDESSFDLNSEHFTMEDVESIIEECVEEDRLEGEHLDQERLEQKRLQNISYLVQTQQQPQMNLQHGNQSANQVGTATIAASQTSTVDMDISPQVSDMTQIVNADKGGDDLDEEMISLKSVSLTSPKHKSKLPLKCDTCASTFVAHSELIKHKKIHGKNRNQCLVCNRWFSKRYLLNAHQKSHTGAKNHECTVCQKRYTSQSNLDRHIRTFHRQERRHVCTTCQKTFSQLSTLRQHQFVHVAERQFSCDVCDGKFKTEVHLKLHKKRHMPTEYRPPKRKTPPKKAYRPAQKMCVCSECGKQFNSIALLRSHKQSHSHEKKYECNICKKRFSFQQTLRNHMFVHTSEKRFKCDTCNMSFRQIGHLQGHKLVHSGDKPHACTVCDKKFALRGNLTVHLRTHTDITPFQCNLCTKKFTDSKGLKRHYQVHERKNELNANIESILNAPIIEFSDVPVVYETVSNTPFFAQTAETIQFAFAQPEVVADNTQFVGENSQFVVDNTQFIAQHEQLLFRAE